jgi:D-inositol-3-phosphate glycosyltransferase
MKRRHPLVRVHHVLIRLWARLRTKQVPATPTDRAVPPAGVLRGHIDEPASGERVAKTGLTLRGWSTWEDQPAVAVVVRANGVMVGRAVVGSEERPDVGEATGLAELVDAGWRVDTDMSAFEPEDPVELSVAVWADPAAPPLELDRLSVILYDEEATLPHSDAADLSSDFIGALDLPLPGEPVDSVFRLEGWALHRSELIEKIDVLVNGHWVQQARMGIVRTDVQKGYDVPEAIISGFECWVDLATAPHLTSHVKLQLVAWAGKSEPEVLIDRLLPLAPIVEVPERHGRDGVLEERRRRVTSSIEAPRSSELDLIVFTHQLGYGGAQLWLDELLVKSEAGDSYACTVISPRDGPLREALERRGIPVHVTNEPPVDDMDGYEGRVTELTALVASGGHNLALVNTASAFVGADVATRLALPTVWAIHESLAPRAFWPIAFSAGVVPGVRSAAEHALATADALIFEAEATRQLYAPWSGADRSIVVPYGVDTHTISAYRRRVSREQARADTGILGNARVVLVMGTIEPRKAQTRIAQAFGLVKDHYPDWDLVFVGDSDTPYSDGLKEYLREAALEDRTKVVPVVDDTYRWYRAADLLLSFSDMESLPRSALEAMCFGVPVLATSVFGLPELLEDERTGFLFEPNDLNAAAAALHRVLALGHSEMAAVGEAGRRHILDRYDSAGYVADFMALFDGLRRDRASTPNEILLHRGRQSWEGKAVGAAG